MRKLASLAVVALFSTGCGSVTLFQAARPIQAQTLQLSLGTQMTGIVGGMTLPVPQPFPHGDAGRASRHAPTGSLP